MTQTIARAMKDGMRRLAAGVSVISTIGVDDKPYAMTVTSVTSVSDAPASLLVCIHQNARIHEHLTLGRGFAINVLTQSQQNVSVACSTGDQGVARFNVGQWSFGENLPPVLTDAEASFLCHVRDLHVYGTHTIVIGDIQAVQVNTQAPQPLLYHNGAYATIK